MAEVTPSPLNALGEDAKETRHPMRISIDQISHEKVTKVRDERRG